MKRSLVTVAVLAMALAGCSQSTGSDPTPSPSGSTSAPVASQSASAAPSETETESSRAVTTSSPTSSPTETPTSTSSTDAQRAFTTGRSQSSDAPFSTDAQALPVAVRVGAHDGYDRLVVEYDDAQAPLEWVSVGWADQGMQEGSGHAVDFGTNRVLDVTVWGVRYPESGGLADLSAQIPSGSVIEAASVEGPFEGAHQIFIGADSDRPYRVFFLENPARIVIDIAK